MRIFKTSDVQQTYRNQHKKVTIFHAYELIGGSWTYCQSCQIDGWFKRESVLLYKAGF